MRATWSPHSLGSPTCMFQWTGRTSEVHALIPIGVCRMALYILDPELMYTPINRERITMEEATQGPEASQPCSHPNPRLRP